MAKRKSTKGQEEFEDTKGVIRIYISKNRQHNVAMSSTIKMCYGLLDMLTDY